MYSFLVLGQVPGTGIVITFTMWLELIAAVLITITWAVLHNRQPKKTTRSDIDFSVAL